MNRLLTNGAGQLPTEKILNFNDREISLVLADGQWWVAIKPVCEALGVNYERQRQNIQEDEILSQLPAEQQVVAADGKMRKMLCIPEMYVYGWLFSIRSDSPGLRDYKLECYRVLFSHFHGRFSKLVERVRIETEMAELQQRLVQYEDFRRYNELQEQKKQIPISLRRMDADLLKGQTHLDL
jgi:hypothetical protein